MYCDLLNNEIMSKNPSSSQERLRDFKDTRGLAARVKEVREKSGETQADFANAMGISVSSVAAIETNRYTPSIPYLRHCRHRYNTTYDYLLDGVGSSDLQEENEYLRKEIERLREQNTLLNDMYKTQQQLIGTLTPKLV